MEKIKSLRLEVDEIDERIMDLLTKRFKVSDRILQMKKEMGLDSFDGQREIEILERARKKDVAVEELYRELLRISKARS